MMWWGWLDLNQRPISYEPTALTTELHPRVHWYQNIITDKQPFLLRANVQNRREKVVNYSQRKTLKAIA